MGDAPASFDVEEPYRFIGRTFTEYTRMFDLSPHQFVGRSVLDCPGGPGSFSAIASQFCSRVVAIDPLYGAGVEVLDPACRSAIDRTVAQLRDNQDLFVWEEYRDVETRGRFLSAAAERFLADYASTPGRYLPGALPNLPVGTNTFDVVLSGNFLFLYDDRLDLAFHRRALLELGRVASDEVRVFPLASLDRERSAYVRPVVDNLREAGLSVDVRRVPYEFQPGATEMLVIRPDGCIGP